MVMRLQLGKVKSNEQEAYAHDLLVLLVSIVYDFREIYAVTFVLKTIEFYYWNQ